MPSHYLYPKSSNDNRHQTPDNNIHPKCLQIKLFPAYVRSCNGTHHLNHYTIFTIWTIDVIANSKSPLLSVGKVQLRLRITVLFYLQKLTKVGFCFLFCFALFCFVFFG